MARTLRSFPGRTHVPPTGRASVPRSCFRAAIASQELAELALRAASCVGADYAGVDIIQGACGRFFVLEVNSMPAWNGLQRVSRIRISDHLVDAFLDAALPKKHLEGREGA